MRALPTYSFMGQPMAVADLGSKKSYLYKDPTLKISSWTEKVTNWTNLTEVLL